MQGILFTCIKGKEKNAVSELYKLLNEFADELYAPEKRESEESSENIEDSFKQEIEKLNI